MAIYWKNLVYFSVCDVTFDVLGLLITKVFKLFLDYVKYVKHVVLSGCIHSFSVAYIFWI